MDPAAVEVVFSPDVYEVPAGRVHCYNKSTLIAKCQAGRHVDYAELFADALSSIQDLNRVFKPARRVLSKS